MDLDQLQAAFSIPGVLAFEKHGELVRARVHTAAAEATIYLQGAHLTHWQPKGAGPVLFLSDTSEFARGKAIRGGVPVIFPWFGPRADGRAGPAHGFARTEPWELVFAAVAGDALHLTLTLGPTEESRGFGYDHFRVAYELRIDAELRLRLSVANEGATPLRFEEALHTYFAMGDVRRTTVSGLEGTAYLDKTDGMQRKPAAGAAIAFTGPTDRVYEGTDAVCTIEDAAGSRRIVNRKTSSETTVVFNPWKAMADLGEEQWPRFVCVETANAGVDAVVLRPSEVHTMEAVMSVEAGC